MAGNFRFGQGLGGSGLQGTTQRAYVTLVLFAINIVVWLLSLVLVGSNTNDLIGIGAMHAPRIAEGEYWRLFTAMFLHADFSHIFSNSVSLLIFGTLTERVYGSVRFSIIYLIGGLVGSVASFMLSSGAVSVGASGAIFAIFGAFTRYLIARRDVLGEVGRQYLIMMAIIGGINFFISFAQPRIDVWAHFGGMVGGLALGNMMAPSFQTGFDPQRLATVSIDVKPLNKTWWIIPIVGAVIVAGALFGTITAPDSPVKHVRAAEQLVEEGDITGALEEIRIAIDLDSTYGESYFVVGKLMAEFGERDDAISNLSLAVNYGLPDDKRREAITIIAELAGQ